MAKCTNTELGVLLHSYELDVLSDKDTERFEMHLMECPHCFREVSEFEQYSTALRFGAVARETVGKSISGVTEDKAPDTLSSRFWPSGPFYLKPGFIYVAILLLIIPAIVGIEPLISGREEIRPVQSIHLAPTRVRQRNILEKTGGMDGIISFVIPEADSKEHINIRIIDQTGDGIVEIKDFSEVDEYGIGRILIPLRSMNPGLYSLVVAEPSEDSMITVVEYRFRINP